MQLLTGYLGLNVFDFDVADDWWKNNGEGFLKTSPKYIVVFLPSLTILCSRRLQESMTSDEPDMAKQYYVDRAIQEVEFVLRRINERWPVEGPQGDNQRNGTRGKYKGSGISLLLASGDGWFSHECIGTLACGRG